MKKEIIIKMPKDAEDIQVYKELSLDNGESILIKVRESGFVPFLSRLINSGK